MGNESCDLLGFDVRAAAVDDLHAQTAIYTATSVIEGLLDRIGWPNDGGSLIDPSCGDGNVLISALARLKPVPGDVTTVRRVFGCEIHPGAVASARERVAAFLVESGWRLAAALDAAREIVSEVDFLTDGPIPGHKFDFVVGNPPYLRYAHLNPYFQNLYRDRLPAYTHGDILHAFLDACVKNITEDGVIAFVTADRWLFNVGAAELRARLGAIVGLEHVCRIDVNTAFYRPKRRVAGSMPRVHPVEVVLRPKASASRAITSSPIEIDESVSVSTRTLSAVADVGIGPWLGNEGVWTIPASDVGKFAGEHLIPAVNAKGLSVKTDRYEGPNRYVIYTSRESEPSDKISEHIKSLRDTLCDRAKTGRWWMPPEKINLDVVGKEKLVVPVCAPRLRVISIPAGVLPYTHQVSVLLPKDGYTLDDIRRLLLSDESQQWFRLHASPIDGGYYQLKTTTLRQLPIPDNF